MDVKALTSTYDFREEIVRFQTSNPIDRHFIYQAAGIAQEDKHSGRAEKNVAYQEAKAIYEAQIMEDDSQGAEADNCQLLRDVFFLLYEIAPGFLRECVTISCDTMNSISTTMNELLSLHRSELGISGRMTKRKCIAAYARCRDRMEEIIKSSSAEDFLRSAYTIGNFVPVPIGCNGPRGSSGAVQDYWDLTLYNICRWYENRSEMHIERIAGSAKAGKERCAAWLDMFGAWDIFVQKNFMQPFVEGGGVRYSYESGPASDRTSGFGPPKALWEGHLEEDAGSVLPKTPEQISAFFTNAAAAVRARSGLMLKALKRKFDLQC